MDMQDFSAYFNPNFAEACSTSTMQNNYFAGNPGFHLPLAMADDQFGNGSQAVKTELEKTIKAKKIANGEEIPTVEYKQQPPPQPKAPEKPEDLQRKREKNKIAAMKCRQKKRERRDVLKKKIQNLETIQTKALNDVLQLRKEKQDLENAIQRHTCMLGMIGFQPSHNLAALVQEAGTIDNHLFDNHNTLMS